MREPAGQNESPAPSALLMLLATLPFLAKWATLQFGLVGYVWQSSYKMFQLAGPLWWRRHVDGRRGLAAWWPIDEPWPARRVWVLAIAIAVILVGTAIAAVSVLAARIGVDPIEVRRGLDARFSLSPLRAVLVVAYLFTINAALEELHFRAWLDRELSIRYGNLVGVSVSAAAFSAMHLFIFAGLPGSNPVSLSLVFLALSVAAGCWSMLCRQPGGIHAAWLSHGLTDAGLLTWGLFWLGFF